MWSGHEYLGPESMALRNAWAGFAGILCVFTLAALHAEADTKRQGESVLLVANCGGEKAAGDALKKAALAFSSEVKLLDVHPILKYQGKLPPPEARAMAAAHKKVNKAALAIRKRVKALAKPEPSLIIIVGGESDVPPFVLTFTYEKGDKRKEQVFSDYPYSDLWQRGNFGPALVRIPTPAADAVPVLERPGWVSHLKSAYLCTLHALNDRVAEVLQGKNVEGITSTRGEGVRLDLLDGQSLLLFQGHGGPQGYADPISLRWNNIPSLRDGPLVVLAGCSTAAPGSSIVRQFLKQGAAGVLGTTSMAHGVYECGYWPLLWELLGQLSAETDQPFPIVLNGAKRDAIREKECEPKLKALLGAKSLSIRCDTWQEAYHIIGVLQFQYYGAPQFTLKP